MIIDMGQPSIAFDGIVEFPDFVFANIPTPLALIFNKIQLIGTNDTRLPLQGSIGGTQVQQGNSINFPGS